MLTQKTMNWIRRYISLQKVIQRWENHILKAKWNLKYFLLSQLCEHHIIVHASNWDLRKTLSSPISKLQTRSIQKLFTTIHMTIWFVVQACNLFFDCFIFAGSSNEFYTITELLVNNDANMYAENANDQSPLDLVTSEKSIILNCSCKILRF